MYETDINYIGNCCCSPYCHNDRDTGHFKGKITTTAKKLANDALNAKVDFTNVEISLFRSFPQLNIKLKNLTITGIGEFENFQLLKTDAFSTSVNLSSLWKTDGVSITEIVLDRPIVSLKVSKAGKSNWDISKSSSKNGGTSTKQATKIKLKHIKIHDASLNYADDAKPMLFSLNKGEFGLSGECKGVTVSLKLTEQPIT